MAFPPSHIKIYHISRIAQNHRSRWRLTSPVGHFSRDYITVYVSYFEKVPDLHIAFISSPLNAPMKRTPPTVTNVPSIAPCAAGPFPVT